MKESGSYEKNVYFRVRFDISVARKVNMNINEKFKKLILAHIRMKARHLKTLGTQVSKFMQTSLSMKVILYHKQTKHQFTRKKSTVPP